MLEYEEKKRISWIGIKKQVKENIVLNKLREKSLKSSISSNENAKAQSEIVKEEEDYDESSFLEEISEENIETSNFEDEPEKTSFTKEEEKKIEKHEVKKEFTYYDLYQMNGNKRPDSKFVTKIDPFNSQESCLNSFWE